MDFNPLAADVFCSKIRLLGSFINMIHLIPISALLNSISVKLASNAQDQAQLLSHFGQPNDCSPLFKEVNLPII